MKFRPLGYRSPVCPRNLRTGRMPVLLMLSTLGFGCSGTIEGDFAADGTPIRPASPGTAGSTGSGGVGNPAGGGTGGGALPVAGALPTAAMAPISGLRRLSVTEYDNTLRELLGDNTRPARLLLPADPRVPFDNDYAGQTASKALVEGLDLVTREAVARLLADTNRRDAVIGCKPTSATAADATCFRKFLSGFGRRALRRPLTAEEMTRYETALLPLAQDSGNFYAAVETGILTFLQHFELLYRVEIGTPVASDPGLSKLGSYEVATRLSYLLWASPPDVALLDAAQQGMLQTAAQIKTAGERLLKDPRAVDVVARFHSLWLNYESLLAETPDIAQAMHQESDALVARVVFEQGRPWQDLFRSTETYIPDALAKNYGLPMPGSTTPKWVKYGASGRQGLLSQGAFLSNGLNGSDTSPTRRGKAIRELLLCETIPPPPPGVNADDPPPTVAGSNCKEDRYAEHRKGGCAGCHALMDPVGFGLEQYDGQGRFRTVEAKDPNCTIRGAGELVGVGTFKGPAELSTLLLQTGGLNSCLVKQLYRFATGRSDLGDGDKKMVAQLSGRLGAANADFKLDQIILDFVSADSFRHNRAEN